MHATRCPRPLQHSRTTRTLAPLTRVVTLCALATSATFSHAEMMVGGFGQSAEAGHPLNAFESHAQGSAAPTRQIAGPSTQLYEPMSGHYEPMDRLLYVADFRGQAIRVYPAFASGNVAPLRVLNPALLGQPRSSAPIHAHQELGVIASGCCIHTYNLNASGSTAQRIRGISWGGLNGSVTQLNNPSSLVYMPATDEYAVRDYDRSTLLPKIIVHARTANDNVAPTRTIVGSNLLGMSGMAHDPVRRRLFVVTIDSAVNAQNMHPVRVRVFDDNSSGAASPLFNIEGPATQLDLPPGHLIYGMGYDPYLDRLMVSSTNHQPSGSRLVVLAANVPGNAAAVQVLQGSQLSPYILGTPFAVPAMAADTVYADAFDFGD